MAKIPISVRFENSNVSNSSFDLLKIEELFRREDIEHSIEEFHKVGFYIILVVTKGKSEHVIDFTTYPLMQRSLLTIREHQIQKFKKDESLKGYLILFKSDFLIYHLNQQQIATNFQVFNDLLYHPKLQFSKKEFSSILNILQQMEEEYLNVRDSYSNQILRSFLHVLLVKLQRKKINLETDIPKNISLFTDFQNLVESDIHNRRKVREYSKLMGINAKTLNEITLQNVHQNTKEFIDSIKLLQIKRLLLTTNLTVDEIAFKTGFKEATTFFKFFKRNTQLTPKQFRQKNQ